MLTELERFIRLANEFFHVRRHKASRTSVIDYAAECHGKWEKLGSGYYGEAWAHEDYPDWVIKISGPTGWGDEWDGAVRDAIDERGSKRPDAWPVFARHCQAHPHPRLPEILYFEQWSQSMAWAVMPRYYTSAYIPKDAEFRTVKAALGGEATAVEWLWPLVQMSHGLHFKVDLHIGNIMIHPESGEWIIIDPFSTTGY